jgi:hypothetical protein
MPRLPYTDTKPKSPPGHPLPDRAVTEGIVHPGFSYCTFGYLLSAPGLRKLLSCGLERALIPVDELIPALYMDHPREDIRSLYPKRLRAYALEPPLITQLPKEEAGSDTEASAFVVSKTKRTAGTSATTESHNANTPCRPRSNFSRFGDRRGCDHDKVTSQ